MKILLLSGAIVFIITGLRQKSRLLNYIAWGNLALVLFGLISLALIIIAPPVDSIFKNALFYYDLGIVFEMAFFLVGLTYKNRMDIIHSVQLQDALVQEREKKNFHEQLAMIQAQQEERNRISADMHDELGGGMTAIRLMSEIARQRNEAEQIPELEKISDSANDLLGKMNAIIWSMSLANDSLSNLIAYVRSYALEFFESTPIRCTVAEEDHLPTVEITGIKRRNLFFAVKEILQLLAKMPTVGEIKLVFEVAGEWLRIRIFYNGSPMDEARDKRDALQPLLSRLNSIGGACHFFTDESNYLELEVPI